MPIYEYNGKRYNIPEAKVQELITRMPGATLVGHDAQDRASNPPAPEQQAPQQRATYAHTAQDPARTVNVPQPNASTFDSEIARQGAGKQLGGGVSIGRKQNIADISGDMYANRELTLPDPVNSAQQQDGFWATGIGDLGEKIGAGALNLAGGLAKVHESLNPMMLAARKLLGKDGEMVPDAIPQQLLEKGKEISERGDRYGLMVDPETGETRKKTYSDLWKEGRKGAAVGEAMLTAAESAPTSAMAMIPGAGLAMIGLSVAGQTYNELDNNPETKDLPEWKKILNASASGAIEGLTERLGAKVDMKVFEPVLKKMGEQTVKGILKKGGIGALIQTITEGGEEVISQLGGNVVDYATGVTDEYKPFEGVRDSFVYGAAGGAQFGGVTGAGTIYRAVEQHKANVETAKVQNTLRLWESINKKQSQALPALNNEKQQLEAELGDLTTLSYEEVLNSPESTPELIQARERYDIVNAEYEGVMENLKREVDDFIAPQVQAIQDVARDGVITELNVGTEDAPDIVYLVKGDVAINEDGTIDPAATSPMLTVKNSEGKKRMIARSKIATAQQDDLNTTIEGIQQRAYEQLVRPVADKLEGKTHFQNGEKVEYTNSKGETVAGTVTAKQNNTVTVVGIDGKKTETFTEDELAQRLVGETIDDVRTRDVIQVQMNGQVYDADVTNIQDGIAELHIPSFPEAAGRYQDVTAAELRRMRVMPQAQVQVDSKTTQETAENEGSPAGEIRQNASETAETGAESQITPEQQQEQFIASLPKTKEGDIDYDKIEDDDTFITALKSEFPEDAAEIVEEYRKQAEKKLKDAGRVQDPIKKKRAQRAAQAQVDRFSNMYERLNPKAQYQARVAGLEEGTIRERESKMGEYLSLRDYLLRNIATGRFKFRWNNDGTNKGLAGEILATKNTESERKIRLPYLDNNGYSPESLAEYIYENAGQGSEINPGWFKDDSDIRNEIIDVLLSYDKPTRMIDAAAELHKQPESLEEYYENFVDPAVIFEYEANEVSQNDMLRSLPTQELHNQISDEEVELYFTGNNSTFDITNTQQYDNQNEGTRAGSDRADAKQSGAKTDQGDNSRNDGGREDQAIGDLPSARETTITGERSAQTGIEQPATEGAIEEPGRPVERPAESVNEAIEPEAAKETAKDTAKEVTKSIAGVIEKIDNIFASLSDLTPHDEQLWAKTSITKREANKILNDIREFQDAAITNGNVEYQEDLDNHNYEMIEGREVKINTYKLNGYTIEVGYDGRSSTHGASGLYTQVENPQGEIVKIYDPKYRTERTIDISYQHPSFIKKQQNNESGPKEIDVEGLFGALRTKGEAKLSDHVKPQGKEAKDSIRKLGTGSNVYFDSNGIRVNDYQNGKVLMNVDSREDFGGPAFWNIEFDTPEEAVKIANELAKIYPNGVPQAVLLDRVVKDMQSKGAEVKPKTDYGANNKIITQERYNELREQMRKKLNNLNVGFDPEVFSIGAQMAMYHIESGAHRFADFAKRMVDDLGDAIRPYLKASYEGARAMPGMEELSKTMDPYKDVVAFDVNQSFEEAQAPKEPWQMTREEYLLTNGLKLVKNLTAEELKEVSKNDNTTIETLKTLPEFAVDISTMKIVGDGYNDNYADVKKAITEGKDVPAEVLAGYPEIDATQSFEEPINNIEQNEFTFKQESPMAYGKAMKILEKRYRYPDGKVMTRYEWIESLPHGLEVRTVKVAAKNDEGYREELWLNQTTITKTEQDYYEYLQQGGMTISDHLAEEEKKAIEDEKKLIEERKAKEEERRKQNEIAQAKQDQNRKDTIVSALQSTRDEFINIRTKSERDYVESFNNRRRKDSAYERDLAVANNNLEARRGSAGRFYDMAKAIYILNKAGNPVRKYNYKVGDKVVVTAWANPVETVIQEIKGEGENAMYVVEKRDGIHNQHVHYDSMRPVEKVTITKEQYESFDTRGYTYAVVKDGKVVTRGSNPILAKEPMPIKSLLDIADNLNGDLYIAPTSGQPIDTRSTDDVIIGGLTWQQILDKQQGKSINFAIELKMPENAVLFPKYEQLYQNDLVENDVPLDSQPIDIAQKAKEAVERDRERRETREESDVNGETKESVEKDKPKVKRFEQGGKLNEKEKSDVLKTMKDSYKEMNRERSLEAGPDGVERFVWKGTAEDHMVVSDITGRKVRWYVTMPDGKIAHPTELYPNMTNEDMKSAESSDNYHLQQSEVNYRNGAKKLAESKKSVIDQLQKALDAGLEFVKTYDSSDVRERNPITMIRTNVRTKENPNGMIIPLQEYMANNDIDIPDLKNFDWERYYNDNTKQGEQNSYEAIEGADVINPSIKPKKGDKIAFEIGGREVKFEYDSFISDKNGTLTYDYFGMKTLKPGEYRIERDGNVINVKQENGSNTKRASTEEREVSEKIEDFGEKIEGAKKDIWKPNESTEESIKTQPLSKTFPRPDFMKLVKDGHVSVDGALILKYLYEEIPSKPRKKHKLNSWVRKVKDAIDVMNQFIDNPSSVDEYMVMLNGMPDYYKDKILLYIKIQKLLGFPSEDINTGKYEIKQFHNSDGYSIVNAPYILGKYKTLEEAVDALKRGLQANKASQNKDEVKLYLYQDRETKKYFIGKKGATGIVRLMDGIETIEEARRIYKEQQPQLQEMWRALKVKPEERRERNRDRIGTDYRKGKNVKPELFSETFGFRGVQFGNWVNSQERQDALNDAYDALMDLSTALGISTRAISLNGELGLAFGARGSGKANAHYEPGQIVINLTKTKGAGSLAHEWWHALDNYFSRSRGESSSYLTEKPRQGRSMTGQMDERIRKEMIDAFKNLTTVINKSDLPKRSKELDKTRSKPYWSTIIEMSARSFENFIIEKMGQTNESNDYLANFKELGEWAGQGGLEANSYPYPTKEETETINAAYQELFDTIQEKVDEETGDVALYRTGQSKEAFAEREWNRGITALNELSSKLGVEIDILETTEGLTGKKASSKGWYDRETGMITIVMPNHSSSFDVQSTLLHEAVGHHGLRELFGEHFDTFLDNVYNNAEDWIKQGINAISEGSKIDIRTATEEYLSKLAEDREVASSDRYGRNSFLYNVRKFFFEMLAKLGFNPGFKLSNNELKYILWRSYNNLAEPGRYRSIVEHAKDVAMQDRLKVGNYAERGTRVNVAEEPGVELPATITINGVERSTTNSEGRPIAPTVEGIRNFYRWFGESKVVDAQGRPLVVYHGTNAEFDSFEKGEFGFHFGTQKQANSIEDIKSILPVYLNLNNPIRIKDLDFWSGEDVAYELKKQNVISNKERLDLSENDYSDSDVKELLSKKGYDGVIYLNRAEFDGSDSPAVGHDRINLPDNKFKEKYNTEDSYIAFNSNQIKSATGNMGSFDPGSDDIRFRTTDDSGFYSTVEDALEKIKQEKGTPEQFKAMLLKNGAKQAEMDWMGWDDFASDINVVTKTDIQDWINQNRIEVTEVKKEDYYKNKGELPSGFSVKEFKTEPFLFFFPDALPETRYIIIDDKGDEWGSSYDSKEEAIEAFRTKEGDIINTKFSQYTLPGGMNYKELLLTMPTKLHSYALVDVETDKVLSTSNDYEELVDRRNELGGELVVIENDVSKGRTFKSSHFDEPNILAHVRFDEREVDGERVLFIEEIQSDWAQEGKKKGFSIPEPMAMLSADELLETGNLSETQRKYVQDFIERWEKTEEDEDIDALSEEYQQWVKKQTTLIPDMPFKKTDQWVNLAFRRMIRYAAENGYDRIAWTTGEQQADRYDLSKQINEIGWERTDKSGTYFVSARKDGAAISHDSLRGRKTISEIEDIFGKEIAEKISNETGKDWEKGDSASGLLTNEDLKVGGEGMKAFYDSIVPKAAKKLGKPFGADVEMIDIPEIGQQQSIPVTEKMIESVSSGLPLFNRGEKMAQLDEMIKAATKEGRKTELVKEIVDEIERNHTSDIEATVVNSRSELIDLLRMMEANEVMVSEAEMSGSPIKGVFFDDMIIINAGDVNSLDDVMKVWVHENFHAWMKQDPDKIVPLRGVFSDDTINGNLYKGYHKLSEDKRLEELLAFAVEKVYVGGPLTKKREFRDHLDPIIKQYLDYVTEGEFSRSNPDFGRGEIGNADARNDNQGSGREGVADVGQGEGTSEQRQANGTLFPSDERVPSEEVKRADKLFDNIDNLKSVVSNYGSFLGKVFEGAPNRGDMLAYARENGFDKLGEGIEQYLADVEDPAELSRIKKLLGVDMPDNALRYMLWRNANPNENTVVWKAKEAVKRNELDENILFSKGEVPSSIKNDKYEQRIRSRHNRGFRSLMYGIEEGWFDRMASLRILQNAITGGKAVSDKANAYMLENQLTSRNTADIRYYTKNLVDPFVKQIHDIFGRNMNAADEYMNAKHGLERNDLMAEEEAKRKYAKNIASLNKEYADEKIDEDTYNEKMEAINGKIEAYAEKLKEEKDYSGLTAIAAERGREDFKAVAQEIVAEIEGGVPKEDIDALWSRVNSATKWILDKQYNAGIMTKDIYEKIRGMYKYYVPLRGFEEVTATDLYEYIDNSPSNFEGTVKKAYGRTSKAESPTATIMSMGESGIMQANRNRMKQAFYRLVATNPSNYASIEDVWFVETADGFEERFPKIDPTASADEVLEAIADFNNDMAELAAEGKAFQGRNKLDIGVKIMKAQASEHVIRVWIAGEEKVIFINGNPRAAQAINGLVQKDLLNKDNLRHGVEYWSRQMAANFTSRNPAFMVTNLMRDVQFAVVSAAVKEGVPYSTKLAKNVFLVGKTISANVFKDGNKDNAEFQKYWEEFEANGGETGYANLHSIDYNKKYVNKKLREFSDQRDFLKPFRAYVQFMENGNRTIEDMSRFATYVTSRQMGRSIERSVSDAKEITINFNRKGSGGFGANLIHSFYLFSNPALQSMKLMGMLAKNHPVRFTAMLSTAMGAGFMVPMINELLLGLFGDDDDKEKYQNITPWVRRNNLVLYAPGTKGKFITLMLPHELRAFYGIGEMAYEKANGGLRRENMAVETAKQMTAMLPIDPMGGPDWWVPDALKPPYQAYVTNRNFMDRPIYRKSIWNEHDPEWTKAYRGTHELLVEAAKGASDMTGGDDVVPGWFNANPARAYHLFSGYLGGFMTTYTDMSMIAFNLLTGRDVRANDVPVVNKLIRTSDEKTEELRINSEYFYYIDWIREYEHRAKGYEKRVQDPEYRDKYMDVMRDKEQRMYNFAKGQIALIDQLKDYDEEKANEMKEQFVRKMWEYEDQD